jgi:hypothetical protein
MNDLERDLRQLFEQHEADLREPRFAPAHAPMPVLRRTRRRQVGVALTALAVIAGVAIGSTVGAAALLRTSDRKMPADQNPTSSPTPGEAGPSSDLADQYSTVLAQGEVDGVAWVIWGNADGVACGFANDVGGIDAGCGHDQRPHGTDLSQIGECIYACPTPGEPIVYGRVSSRATSVRLVLDDGSTLDGVIHPAPPELPSDVRFFTITTDRLRGLSGTLFAIGPDGGVLEHLRYPWRADQPGGPAAPVTLEATLASGAPTIEYDGRPYEPERWEVAVWRNGALDWCLGTIFPNASKAVVATEGRGCEPRERLFDGIRSGAIGHADVWWMNALDTIQEPVAPQLSDAAQEWFLYRAWGTVSAAVAAVRMEVADGSVVEAQLYDPPSGFEDMGRLFVAEFRSKLAPLEWDSGMGGITWRAVALDANGQVLGSNEASL